MAYQSYVQLGWNDGTNLKKFVVLQGSYKAQRDKTQTRKRTITGKADTQEGFIIKSWSMTVIVRETPLDASYGSIYDLRTFFEKNAASGSACGRLTFIEFDDSKTHLVELPGQMYEDNITSLLFGTDTQYYVPLILEKVN